MAHQVEHFAAHVMDDYIKKFTQKGFDDSVNDPTVAKSSFIAVGARTVYGGSVYLVKEDGTPERIGLSWNNTTETIGEHDR